MMGFSSQTCKEVVSQKYEKYKRTLLNVTTDLLVNYFYVCDSENLIIL